ncbi:Cys-tRNA(Pro)/Cys-tRNA(Cys) deacylase [Cytobacillus eiseniae]|uniref:Cys-tRNA(Pro)/Cys-tRNA(Cys) deacylase n=1 Tax=Cytobacillus eiseniae TaxID=762947 RepID=A0ABS4RGN3_9BACI|nr:Cys-tRNA(Pro) deacylase [Cytobacillus eiseniae]MBP2242043.1 Cys-tRNA(Pro)/Cys-tRNA(Cys) deacylase [Cytobacillus eiseniae]
MAQGKTNAMRILDAKKVPYEILTYQNEDGKIDGVSVAQKINKDEKLVYKTLVAEGNSKQVYVFIIPVGDELDMKKAAKAVGEKRVEMIAVKDIQRLTGYIRGGCSPVGMKKQYPSFLDLEAAKLERIIISGGRIGMQMELNIEDLQLVIGAKLMELVKWKD